MCVHVLGGHTFGQSFLYACGLCGTRGTENVRESSVIHISLVINMNKQGQCQTPERTHSLIHWGTALCVFVTVFVCMSISVCLCV